MRPDVTMSYASSSSFLGRLRGQHAANLIRRYAGLLLAFAAVACGAGMSQDADWPPLAKQWYERAQTSFRELDVEDARDSIEKALHVEPNRVEIRELAGRISLSMLDYQATLTHVKNVDTSTGRGLRARALWYSGHMVEAADELELLLADPNVRDTWAEGTIKLARQARGRTPFAIKGDLLAVMEMPRLQNTAMVVPVELNGQPVLALVATGTPEVVLDSAGDRAPSWVTLRFDQRLEVKDVPALTQDLSGLSRDLNAPIKLLLGTHLLRHLNATVDFLGRQFVVRSFEPPPPPEATKVELTYIRGGGMALKSRIGDDENARPYSFLVDTGSAFTVVLDGPAWDRTAIDPALVSEVPGSRGLKQGPLPQLQLGAYGIPNVPAVSGVALEDLEKRLDTDVDGLVGSGLLGAFRVTWTDGGRAIWLEDAAVFVGGRPTVPRPAAPGSAEPTPTPAPSGAVPQAPAALPTLTPPAPLAPKVTPR